MKNCPSAPYILISLLLVSLFASCEVDFSPNAEWKETPSVYCILDQDDDTTWVRVEKCFLAEENIYSYGLVSDSINYPQGSIKVSLIAYNGTQVVDTIDCQYTERDRPAGSFASTSQPLYYTTEKLRENYLYQLEIRRTADSRVIANTDIIPLIKTPDTSTHPFIHKPFSNGLFGFSGGSPSFEMEWYSMPNARRYQPIIRFYYRQDGDTQYVDVPCSKVLVKTDPQAYMYSSILYRNEFLQGLKEAFRDNHAAKYYLKYVDVYVTSCNEDFNVYLNTVDANNSIDQGTEAYSNIHNGVGVFAARRTHLCKRVDADSSLSPNQGLYYFLVNLGVGFGGHDDE